MIRKLFKKSKNNDRISNLSNLSEINDGKAECLIDKYGFEFHDISKAEIRKLLEAEMADFQQGSSEYIRLLCGYLFCIGDKSDISLIKKAKYEISFDVQVMIDNEWIENLEDSNADVKARLINEFVEYYTNYFGLKNN